MGTSKADGTTIADMRVEFLLHLRAENKSPATLKVYGTAVAQLDEFLAATSRPRTVADIGRDDIEAFVADQIARRSASTAKTRFGGLQAFFGYLVDVDEIERSPMERLKPPHVPEKPVNTVSDDDVRRLLENCACNTFDDVRDAVIFRLLIDTGMRRAELAGLRLDDVDTAENIAVVLGEAAGPGRCPSARRPLSRCGSTSGTVAATRRRRRPTPTSSASSGPSAGRASSR